MSSTADKKANRAHLKAQQWNQMPEKPLRVAPTSVASSWWVDGADPNARGKFVELARARNGKAWSTVVPHAMNPRGENS